MSRRKLNHYVLLTSGWAALGAGLLVLPVPVPLPFPLAATLLLGGASILSAHSRNFRHGIQFARHRYGWLSRMVDLFADHAPESVRRSVRRTRPDLVARHRRIYSGRAML